MTQLRNKMLKELQRRIYFHRTATSYIRIVGEFAEHFQAPDKRARVKCIQIFPLFRGLHQ